MYSAVVYLECKGKGEVDVPASKGASKAILNERSILICLSP